MSPQMTSVGEASLKRNYSTITPNTRCGKAGWIIKYVDHSLGSYPQEPSTMVNKLTSPWALVMEENHNLAFGYY